MNLKICEIIKIFPEFRTSEATVGLKSCKNRIGDLRKSSGFCQHFKNFTILIDSKTLITIVMDLKNERRSEAVLDYDLGRS